MTEMPWDRWNPDQPEPPSAPPPTSPLPATPAAPTLDTVAIIAAVKNAMKPTPTEPAPSKAKTWLALVGGLLTVAIPLLLQLGAHLPEPWPAIIGAIVAVLTALGVYHAPYTPAVQSSSSKEKK